MSLSILNNVASMNAQRHLNKSQQSVADSLSKLSSGLRVRSAKDDAAGLAIAENLRADVRSFAVAERNALDGVSMAQVADGALGEIGGILTRMRELAVQASSGQYGDQERIYVNDEYEDLAAEIDRIADTAEFNGTTLLDGSMAAGVAFQVGIANSANDRLSLSIADTAASVLGVDAATLTMSTAAGAQAAIAAVDTAITAISTRRSGVGVFQNRLDVTISNIGSARENLAASESRIRDVDVAFQTAELTRSQILLQAGVSVLAQANQSPSVALSLLA